MPAYAAPAGVTIHDERVGGRHPRDDDPKLVEVGGDGFLEAAAVAAAEQVASGKPLDHAQLVRAPALLDAHLVPRDDVELPATQVAGHHFAAGQFDDYAPSV